ncbi:MAG: trehalase, partial [Gemmatimonadaceae bacterium]|nr:trehalase [Chitinophagaceae bacterium]
TDIVPVDLNCLLLHMEETLIKLYSKGGNADRLRALQERANSRHTAIQRYCRNGADDFYVDFHLKDGVPVERPTLAAVFPLFFGVASPEQAGQVAKILDDRFLTDGGLLTTLETTGQQWDAPNGWAPLQWMAYMGLQRYGLNEMAGKVRERWTKNCEKVYSDTGKMMEKYNVEDISIKAGGGKYPNQDGFGWTNGVYISMKLEEKGEMS